jgi:cation diffusion facilitator family transporter
VGTLTRNLEQIEAHTQLQRTKQQAALWSIVASVVITLGKGITGLMSGSLALISDAAHSLLDIAATSITYWAIKAADKPADDEHHYGHGKVESLAALFETAFLLILAGVVAYEGLRRLHTDETAFIPSWPPVVVLVISIVIDAWRWWGLKRVARETHSEALEADALHFSSDLINSVLVLIAFGLAAKGFPQADSWVAIGVAVFIAVAGYRLARRTLNTLIDAAPLGSSELIESKVIAVAGVVGVDQIRVRTSGGRVLGEVMIRVSRTLPLESVAHIKQQVLTQILEVFPTGLFTLTADPVTLDEETVLERVMLIGLKLKVPVHHVTIQTLDESHIKDARLSISADLEINRTRTLLHAHAIATRFEEAIRAEFGPATEVETHLEPLEESALHGEEAPPELTQRIHTLLSHEAEQGALLHGVHDVRVRQTSSGLVVNYHCLAAADLNVEKAHTALDTIERTIRSQMPDVIRIVGHAEPVIEGAHGF